MHYKWVSIDILPIYHRVIVPDLQKNSQRTKNHYNPVSISEIISVSFVHWTDHIWQQCPTTNKLWLAIIPVL